MGRIQKKKNTTAKKKSLKNKTEGTGLSSGTGSATGAQPAKKSKVLSIKKPSGGAKAPVVKTKKNVIDKSLQFLREVRVELKKVTWPSRKQTLGSTVVVIILVMIISFFLGAVDFGLSNLVRAILQ
ncbi:MAG: preprotein translocase subunit SecE [Deltaproteobacteria bacterium]|nr:preprotein translocase subunit SecE [Deltaproteobacteria bacterium]MBW2177539.1 preprotein translocase subunit SecE [Deltaproteobacteria bacterium]MBW2296617.1 preprotein translocase subunit SecE [Deltaproteobacteria bacterium]MBW2678734.1 preprotein translocase subunit SecE [Deltaproteobacteria bacterium]